MNKETKFKDEAYYWIKNKSPREEYVIIKIIENNNGMVKFKILSNDKIKEYHEDLIFEYSREITPMKELYYEWKEQYYNLSDPENIKIKDFEIKHNDFVNLENSFLNQYDINMDFIIVEIIILNGKYFDKKFILPKLKGYKKFEEIQRVGYEFNSTQELFNLLKMLFSEINPDKIVNQLNLN